MSTTQNPEPSSEAKALATINPNSLASDVKGFTTFIRSRSGAIAKVAASHMNPVRITRIVIAAVTRTPRLKECTMASILNATMQAAELGLEAGSATGEAYLVPYGKVCTLIPGYRGLISLAFRSGFVLSIRANVVYQGDAFTYEEGLTPQLTHIPAFDAPRDPKQITFAYCVIQLKDGGMVYDVMTRGEIDAIRQRSKAGGSGPWVTDYAEMAKKTVCRRTLKYAPMSVEMGKAMALDAADAGETTFEDIPEFDFMDVDPETGEVIEPKTKTQGLKDKLGVTETVEEPKEALAV